MAAVFKVGLKNGAFLYWILRCDNKLHVSSTDPDKSGANKAAIDQIVKDNDTSIVVRQVKYLNNIVEQDHRAVKRITKPMLGFKSFQSAKNILAGIELMHMIRKDQIMMEGAEKMSFAEQFYTLAR